MRPAILATTRDLLEHRQPRRPTDLSLDEIAACTGITLHHLRAYYTSTHAVRAAAARGGRDALD